MIAKHYQKRVQKYLSPTIKLIPRYINNTWDTIQTDRHHASVRGTKKNAEIIMHEIKDEYQFICFLHEMGHVKLGHLELFKGRSEEDSIRINGERAAWLWAFKECKKLNKRVTKKMITLAERMYHTYVRESNALDIKQTIFEA